MKLAKLSESQIRDIKSEISRKKHTQKEIADMNGVSRSLISDIACGRVHHEIKADIEMTEEEAHLFNLQAEVEHLREERNTYKRQLKQAAKTQGLFQAMAEELGKNVSPFKPLPPSRPAFKTNNTIEEHLVMHLSDGHHDQIITPEDTGGLEYYDFSVSTCRAERLVDTTLKWTQQTLAPQFRFPSLTVLAYGDHTSGEIHGHTSRSYFRNAFKNCLAIGQLHALMYRDLAPYFEHVNVLYVPGNHGRRSRKKDYLGAHDNWDYLIAKTAELYLRDVDNITFQIPNAFCANVDIGGVGFQVFHGDDVRSSL